MTIQVKHSKVSTIPDTDDTSLVRPSDWNADHTLVGLGTMAEQNANAVAITGGTINGTTIGATTPSSIVGTTLEATDTLTLNKTNAATAKVWSNTNSSPIADLELQRGTGTVWGDDAFTDYRVRASGGNFIIQSKNNATSTLDLLTVDETNNAIKFSPAGVEQMRVTRTASAVNYAQITGAAAGSDPTLSAQGSDTNINFTYLSKGSAGEHRFSTNTGGNTQFRITHTGSAANYLTVTGAATGGDPVLSAQGSDTNIDLVLSPKGTGAIQAQATTSTTAGGNVRGANAVDWQTVRGSAGQVASGTYSVIAGGTTNNGSGFGSFIGSGFSNTNSAASYGFLGCGTLNTVSGNRAVVVGGSTNTAAGLYSFIGGGFTNSGTANAAVTTQSGTMNGTTAVTLSGSNASIKVGQYITGTSIAADTYVAAISGTALTLSVAASGSSTSTLSFFTPHGVVVGGGNNQATGAYSAILGGGDAGTAANRNVASGDWSFVGGGTLNTASGLSSVVVGGGINPNSGTREANTASGGASFVGGGAGNTASGNIFASVVGGRQNLANSSYGIVAGGAYGTTRLIIGNTVFPASNTPLQTFAQGSTQSAMLVLARQTTDATATALASDGNAAGTTNQVILPNNSAYLFKATVISNVTGGGNTSGWKLEGVIKRGANAASTAIVGSVTTTLLAQDAGASGWVIAATADTTNGGLRITFTGQASTTIRTVCKVETTEVTF